MSQRQRHPRIAMVAYSCHPDQSMESRNGWRRVLLAAEHGDVTAFVGPNVSIDELRARLADEPSTIEASANAVEFVTVPDDRLTAALSSIRLSYYAGYRRWMKLAYRMAKRRHAAAPFDLAHQVNYCGYREPGLLWKLGVPFVWGPIGGTQDFPWAFLGSLGWWARVKEVVRSIANQTQLRCSRRVRRAASAAAVTLAATQTAQHDLHRALGIETERQLETGLDCPIASPREPRDPAEPLRILWAGRLQAWKGFELLAHAIAKLPDPRRVEVRVLGTGPQGRRWRQLCERLGVADRVTWHEWPGYTDTLPHYRWADAFAFTSLRDTSGTGLLEALAAGAPIVGVDHQGAADVMTPGCAIAIPVSTPDETIDKFATAFDRLATDASLLLDLSRGSQQRAAEFGWQLRSDFTQRIYAEALGQSAVEHRLDCSETERPVNQQQTPADDFPTAPTSGRAVESIASL